MNSLVELCAEWHGICYILNQKKLLQRSGCAEAPELVQPVFPGARAVARALGKVAMEFGAWNFSGLNGLCALPPVLRGQNVAGTQRR